MTRFNIGSGKSDSFFFNTANSTFIIKTLKEEECQLLVRKGILEKYYAHIRKNPCSMLARFYGIYTVNIKFMKPISVVIMDNLMGQHIEDIISIYDLKGSLHKRITKQVKHSRTVKKDLNFLLEPQFFMKVDPKVKRDFLQRLHRDKEFLKSCNLMDYSLLMIFLKQ
jgi:1-phosphatidylinositol-4-phosphate 5-kinase